jgi:CDP-diacylglycerol--glycerol-3-phosphate 3-phosphatidyltransferase
VYVSTRNLPNLLGLFRIIATPFLVLLVVLATPWADLSAAFLLLVMAITDIIDGRLARKLQVVSPFGVFLDTISDKIFVAGAMIPMVERGLLPGWFAVIVVVREFAVSGLRSYAASTGLVISARQWGKQKMIFQVMALIWRLIDTALAQIPGAPVPLIWLASLWPIPVGLALIWTIISGARSLMRDALPGKQPTD